MILTKWFGTAAVFVMVSALTPQPAAADWVLTPFVGWNFGGSAGINAGSARSNTSSTFERKIDYGASLAAMGNGVVGFEVDFGYSPNFFESGTAANGFQFTNDSNVTTLTGNIIIGAPIGGQGGSIRPYVIGGVGLIRTNVQDIGQVFSVHSKNDFGMDVGGGVMGFFSDNVGLRGDIRYFRGFRGTSDSDNVTGITLADFKFWRGSLGLSLKF